MTDITQADRKAAASVYNETPPTLDCPATGNFSAGLSFVAQAFARHRIIAVNHHQALVDALREARDLFRKLETSRGTRGYIQSRSRLGASRIDTLLSQIGAA